MSLKMSPIFSISSHISKYMLVFGRELDREDRKRIISTHSPTFSSSRGRTTPRRGMRDEETGVREERAESIAGQTAAAPINHGELK